MKKVLLTLSALLFVNFAQAEGDLKTSMKSMGQQFGLIAQGLRMKKITEVEMAAVEKMQRDIAESSLIQPDTATTTEDKLTYSTWMAELMEASFRLEDAMQAGMEQNPVDVADAVTVFGEMGELRKKGHTKFKLD